MGAPGARDSRCRGPDEDMLGRIGHRGRMVLLEQSGPGREVKGLGLLMEALE